jgi:hypothetical protein
MEKYTVPSDADLNWKIKPNIKVATTLEVPNELIDYKVEEFGNILKDMINLYAKKNHDYGDAFERGLDFIGPKYALSRLFDKVNRFATFSNNTEFLVKDESVEDTLIDLANYSIMTIIAMRRSK